MLKKLATRDRDMIWKRSTSANYYADTREGGRYIVTHWGQTWSAQYLPNGSADKGWERVPLAPGGTLAATQRACDNHYRALATTHK